MSTLLKPGSAPLVCCYFRYGGGILSARVPVSVSLNCVPFMNFIIYLSFGSFVTVLKPNLTVYLAAFTQGSGPTETGYLLVTTEAGVEGGTVHSLQIRLMRSSDDDSTSSLDLSQRAYDLVEEFLKIRQIKIRDGLISTAGLEESLEHWRHSGGFTLDQLSRLIDRYKETK
jgi:hypothetical protein